MSVTIREIRDGDFFGWLPLFEAYCRVRGVELDDTKALVVWSWIQDPRSALRGIMALSEDDTPVGLVHYHPEPRTIDGSVGLVVDDLYVDGEHRRNGVARQMLRTVRERAVELHATRVSWAADPDDAEGIRISDELGRRDAAVAFEMEL
ncbi:N-acetyltransferase family protein [Agromyces arachidis]|uniref:N-acetyltransferase family protein n=1 Tax=Agromyces arachidis TaxID=766966 RepID=UPI004056AAA5